MGTRLGPISFVKALARLLAGRAQTPPSLSENKLLATVLNRRSVRSFRKTEIPEDVLAAILEAGRLAPSTVNLQTWTFGVFTPEQWRQVFGSAIPFKGRKAIIILGDIYRVRQAGIDFPASPLIEYTIAVMNASLAAMNMNLAAEALGVSSVMLSETGRSGLLDVGYLANKLHLPEKVFPLMTMVFGYASGAYPPMPPKLPLEQISFSDQYPAPNAQVMQDWLEQMVAGYKTSHLSSSFEAQLGIYQSKISQAEHDLRKMVFPKEAEPPKDLTP
jgi:FMN reductase (NADPH)